jgi:hypothetical protein
VSTKKRNDGLHVGNLYVRENWLKPHLIIKSRKIYIFGLMNGNSAVYIQLTLLPLVTSHT